jgi:hypothetical protein
MVREKRALLAEKGVLLQAPGVKRDNFMSTHQVRGQQDLGALVKQVLEGGHSSTNAGVVCDVLLLVQRHVQVCTKVTITVQHQDRTITAGNWLHQDSQLQSHQSATPITSEQSSDELLNASIAINYASNCTDDAEVEIYSCMDAHRP